MLDRRAFMAAGLALSATPAFAQPPAALLAYERKTGGKIGVYAANLVTGATIAWRANQRFVMCSTFKASLAGLVLTRVDRGQDRLESMIAYGPRDVPDWYAPVARRHLAEGGLSVGQMCAAAVEVSDNTCANLLLARVGGPAALTRFWRALGDPFTRLDHPEPELNRSPPGDPHDTTTPRAMAGNLRRLLLDEALSPASRKHLTRWMLNCQTGAERLRGGLPASWRIADKTGNNGKDAAGDIALAWDAQQRPHLICAYVQGGSPADEDIRAVFAEVGRMASRQLS